MFDISETIFFSYLAAFTGDNSIMNPWWLISTDLTWDHLNLSYRHKQNNNTQTLKPWSCVLKCVELSQLIKKIPNAINQIIILACRGSTAQIKQLLLHRAYTAFFLLKFNFIFIFKNIFYWWILSFSKKIISFIKVTV